MRVRACALSQTNYPGAFELAEKPEGHWKSTDASADGPSSFSKMWGGLTEAKRAQVAALTAIESPALLTPNAAAPAAFPPLPVGMRCFIDEAAATDALSSVPGLQYKHYTLVPAKLPEMDFWVNFFSHVTVIHNA